MTLHQDLAAGRWKELSLMEQLANIGSEVDEPPGRGRRATNSGWMRPLIVHSSYST